MEIQLRVILLGVGVIILLVVAYDLYKRKPKEVTNVDHNLRNVEEYTEPSIDLYPLDSTLSQDVVEDNQSDLNLQEEIDYDIEQDMELVQEVIIPQNIITISIMSRDKYGFNGKDLLAALEGAKLYFGKNDIFHRFANDDDPDDQNNEVLFSVANAVEPGYFYIETLPEEHVRGVILILLPEKTSIPHVAFDKLVRTAKQMAFALNGELLDHERQPLTLETIDKYRRKIQRK